MNVLDVPAVVHMIRPTKATDLQQYVDHHFIPYIASVISESASRAAIIWDTYPDLILKLRPNPDEVILAQKLLLHHPSLSLGLWKMFLGNAENKIQLFRYLSKAIVKAEHLRNVIVYSIYDDTVLINSFDQQSAAELKTIMPCNHQEAESRIFFASV